MLITTDMPPSLANGDNALAFWKLDESADTLHAAARQFLTDGDERTYATFKNDRRRREWLATRLAVNETLGHYPGIEYDGGGRPRLGGTSGGIKHISISHTDGLVGVMISGNPNTGIDIERMTPRILRIKHKFLHPDEYDYVGGEGLQRLLYIQWCAKEAMYKAINVNDYDFQNTYTLPNFQYDGSTHGLATGRAIMDDGSTRYMDVNYLEIDGCVCCIASHGLSLTQSPCPK